jgi:hypothetical protein
MIASETSVDNHFTRQYIPEDNSELHTRRRENLKSHKKLFHNILEGSHIFVAVTERLVFICHWRKGVTDVTQLIILHIHY